MSEPSTNRTHRVSAAGFVSNSAGGLEQREFSSELAANGSEVLIEVTHCAVGRGDVDFVDRRFTSDDVVVPGHEIVGVVIAVGPDVSGLLVGARVGVGYQVTSCGECTPCSAGTEQHCRTQQCLIVDRPGGFGVFVRADERFVVVIPDGLSSAEAAPLMSAGLTAFSAIRSSDIVAEMNVAVVGLGGMGHVATQLLHNAGARVTAITSKQADVAGSRLGAAHTIDPSAFFANPPVDVFDRIFVTSGLVNNLDPLLTALTPVGALVMLGSPSANVEFSVFKLNDFSSRKILGSYIGSPDELREVAQLAESGKLSVKTTSLPFDEAPSVIRKVRENTGGYRVVLERDCTTE